MPKIYVGYTTRRSGDDVLKVLTEHVDDDDQTLFEKHLYDGHLQGGAYEVFAAGPGKDRFGNDAIKSAAEFSQRAYFDLSDVEGVSKIDWSKAKTVFFVTVDKLRAETFEDFHFFGPYDVKNPEV